MFKAQTTVFYYIAYIGIISQTSYTYNNLTAPAAYYSLYQCDWQVEYCKQSRL